MMIYICFSTGVYVALVSTPGLMRYYSVYDNNITKLLLGTADMKYLLSVSTVNMS